MLARNVGARALRQCASKTRIPTARVPVRRFSASSSAPSNAAPTPTAHPLAGVATQLDHVAPRFEIDPSEIEIIDSPTAFYETLKVWVNAAASKKTDR